MGIMVDTAAVAVRPAPQALSGWAAEQRVFISSVMSDLKAERRAVAEAIRSLGAQPIWFENFGGRDDDAEAAYLAEVRSSTIYVGILGRTYGRLSPARLSATHEEYREAERVGLRMSVWARSDGDFQGDQKSFVDEVRIFHTTGQYDAVGDLAAAVAWRIGEMGADDLSPWVKIGDAIFRAKEIRDDGQTLTVEAVVHAPSVVSELEALRPGSLLGDRESRITYAGRSMGVRVKSVVTRVSDSRATALDVVLKRAPDTDPANISASVNLFGKTYSPDDILELKVRRALFGQPGPTGLISFGRNVGDPLAKMPPGLPNDTFAAVLGLLITEGIVGQARASRVTKLRISPVGPLGRRIVLEWVGPVVNKPGETRIVEEYLKPLPEK